MTLGLAERLKNSNLILESKIAELNLNKKSQQPGWPDSVKTLLYLGNKSHTTQLFTRILQNGFSKKTCEKGAKLVGCLWRTN